MSKETRPAFFFYASDWLTSTAFMDAESRGTYINLLAYQWVNGELPNDLPLLCRLAGVDSASSTTTSKLQALIKQKFKQAPSTCLINERLERVRAKESATAANLSERGRKGSRGSRWCRAETMPADPNERLSSLVVKHGAAIIARFVTEANALDCGSAKVAKALHRYVDNLLYGRYDLHQKSFPPVLRDFVCKFFGYEQFEDCFTPMRVDHLARQVDKFAFPHAVLRKLQRAADCLTQLKTMGVKIKPDDLGLFFEMQGATHASDYAIITVDGELRRRKLITEQASEGNDFSLAELEGNRQNSIVNLD